MVGWVLYVPRSRQGIDDLVAKARAAEAAGFDGVALLDHLERPMAPATPIWEAMTAAWVSHSVRPRGPWCGAGDGKVMSLRRLPWRREENEDAACGWR